MYVSYYSISKSLYIQVGPKVFLILLLGSWGPALYLRVPYLHSSMGIC